MTQTTLPTETLGLGRASMLVLWFVVSFGTVFFARDLQFDVFGWPLGFWLAAQGIVLIFVCIVAAYAWFANRAEVKNADAASSGQGSGQ